MNDVYNSHAHKCCFEDCGVSVWRLLFPVLLFSSGGWTSATPSSLPHWVSDSNESGKGGKTVWIIKPFDALGSAQHLSHSLLLSVLLWISKSIIEFCVTGMLTTDQIYELREVSERKDRGPERAEQLQLLTPGCPSYTPQQISTHCSCLRSYFFFYNGPFWCPSKP